MRRAGKYILRTLLVIFTILVWLVLVAYLSINTIVKGPSVEARDLFVTSMLESGQMKWVVGMVLDSATVTEIVEKNSMVAMEQDSDASLIQIAETPAEEEENTEPIVVEKVAGDNYTGTMMIVR